MTFPEFFVTIKTSVLYLAGLILSFAATAQPVKDYLADKKMIPYQKLYLHTDREFYFPGDTLWFSAYLVDGYSHQPVSDACNLYVELMNPAGETIMRETFFTQYGLGSGYMHLTGGDALEGKFLLRAYTDYLRNFGQDAFFTKNVHLSSIKSSLEVMAEDSAARESTELDVQFMPEGGFLMAGEINCVAFRAVDGNGKGRNISGKLLDESNRVILNFSSVYRGAGKFYFQPDPDKRYRVVVEGFSKAMFRLPEARESGAKLMLVSYRGDELKMVAVEKNAPRSQPYYLVCMHRGEGLFFLEINSQKMNSILKLDATKLRSGINRMVLLDSNLKPVSERLVFNNRQAVENLRVDLNKSGFTTRDDVQVRISHSSGDRELKFLSMAVIDENYVNASGVSQNILSWLLLDSELNGSIETPADYFIPEKDLQAEAKLDLLMLTQGWHNYVWNRLEEHAPEFIFKPQLGFRFTGEVLRTFGKKPLTEGVVTFVLFQKDTIAALMDQTLDETGKFDFNNLLFYDSAHVFVQARNRNNKNTVQFRLDQTEKSLPGINPDLLKPLFSYSSVSVAVHRQRYLNELRLKEFYPDKDTKMIGEVEVKGKKPVEKIKSGTIRKNDGAYLLDWSQTSGSGDILNFLRYKVSGVHPIVNSDGLPSVSLVAGGMGGEPAFMVDGFKAVTAEEIQTYPIEIFESIEMITPPMSNIYGPEAYNGAVVLTIKSGASLTTANKPLLGGMVERIKGYSVYREFYSPVYTEQNLNSPAPDFRNTLYWNPWITMDSEDAVVSFFTADNLSRYRIYVEGVSRSGRIFMGTGDFEVNTMNKFSTGP